MKNGSMLAMLALCVALAPLTAIAGEQEDQGACMNDALTVCSQFIPDRERVASCLISNPSRISEACRTALTHFDPRAASPSKLTAANQPAASPSKLSTVNQLVASPTKLTMVNRPVASRAKSTAVNQPLALLPKSTAASHPVPSRVKLTAVR